MAFTWRGCSGCFMWASLVFLLMTTVTCSAAQGDQDFVPTAGAFMPASLSTVTPASSISCEEIHGDAFGNQTLKPGVCYLAADVEGDFLEARAYCQGLNDSLGWDVADIEDAVENQLIQDALTSLKENGSFSSPDTFWVGQNDRETENTWLYLNASSNTCNRTVYLNWRSGQPNEGRRQNCVAYFYNDGGNFQDRSCDDSYYHLCKVKVTSDTVPSCPDFVEDTSTEAPDPCLDIWPLAFGNPAVPGVCYADGGAMKYNFEEALSYCSTLLPVGSWSVADIEDAEENLFLEAWNRDNFPKRNGYWIGQNDREQEGDWRYTSSGQCPVYLNWRSSQPNGDLGGREQNCAVMFKRDDGQWQDKACNENRYVLCKLKTDPGPTLNPEFINCNGSTLPSEVAECKNLNSKAFGSIEIPGFCYFISDNKFSWEMAVDSCEGHGWDLMDIESALENDVLAARFRDFRPDQTEYWVGQNDQETEGVWKYSSNSTPVTNASVFLNFKESQPNDGGHTQNCIMMDTASNDIGQWEDKACTEAYYVTCKKRVGRATTTATAWTDPCPGYQESSFGNEANPGVCYILTNERSTWEEAEKACIGYGSGWQVPDIVSEEDLKAFVTANSRLFSGNDGYWIGQNDRAVEGTWVYKDGTLTGSVFLHWDTASHQPDGGTAENCAVFSASGSFKDVSCGSGEFYIACTKRNAHPYEAKITEGPRTPAQTAEVSTTKVQSTESATTQSPTTEGDTTQAQTTQGPTTQAQTTESATTEAQTTEGATTPSMGTTELPTTLVTTRQPSTEGATTGQPIATTEHTTVATTQQQTTEGATTKQQTAAATIEQATTQATIGQQTTEGAVATQPKTAATTTEQPTTQATTRQQTTEGAIATQPTDSAPITGSGRFLLKSSNATCSSATSLHTSPAKDRFHCARKCLIQGNCRSFSFTPSGNENACELCSEILDANSLQFKTGSLYYFEI